MKKYPHILLAAGGAVHLYFIVYNLIASLSLQLSGTASTLYLILTLPTILYNIVGTAVAAFTFKNFVQKKSNPFAVCSAVYYALAGFSILLSFAMYINSMLPVAFIIRLAHLCACCCAFISALIIRKNSKKFVSENTNEENPVDP